MDLVIDAAADTPPYEQILAQVLAKVEAGDLLVGDRLPPIRTLATRLGLAAGTVARAYRELESDGVVETRGRSGTVIAPSAVRTDIAVRQAAEAYAATVSALGVPREAAVRAVVVALESTNSR